MVAFTKTFAIYGQLGTFTYLIICVYFRCENTVEPYCSSGTGTANVKKLLEKLRALAENGYQLCFNAACWFINNCSCRWSVRGEYFKTFPFKFLNWISVRYSTHHSMRFRLRVGYLKYKNLLTVSLFVKLISEFCPWSIFVQLETQVEPGCCRLQFPVGLYEEN